MHFNEKDVDRGNEFQTRCTLKTGAVPSIGVPHPICPDNVNINSTENYEIGNTNDQGLQLFANSSNGGNIYTHTYT